MKKIFIISIFICLCMTFQANAQDRHRANDEPYDIFLSVRGHYIAPQDNFSDNYSWGGGFQVVSEWQYEELNLSWGISVGYDRFQPKYLKWDYVPTKQLFAANQMPLTLFVNYYILNKRSIKPYIGIGGGLVWGKYDYSFSTMQNDYTTGLFSNLDEYYYREFEAATGVKFGYIPHIGCMFSWHHRHAIGIELSMENYFEHQRLEKQKTYSATLYYTFIID